MENSKGVFCFYLCPEIPHGAETVEQFFDRLKKKYKWTNQGKIKAVLEALQQQEINTTEVLKELWEDIKSELPLSIGLKIGLEEEMKRLQISTDQWTQQNLI